MPRPPSQERRAYRQHRARVLAILRAYEEHPNPTAGVMRIRKLLGEAVALMIKEDEPGVVV